MIGFALGALAAATALDGRRAPPPGHTQFWVYAHWKDGYQFDTSRTITGARAALKAFIAQGPDTVSILWGNDEGAFTQIDAVQTWSKPGLSGLGMPALHNYDTVYARFLDAARHVWGRSADFVIPHIQKDYRDRPPKDSGGHDVHAALLTIGGPPRAIRDSIVRRAKAYGLLLNDSIYALPDDMIWRVLVHEAVHLGIPGHGEDFRRLVVEKGGVVSGAGTKTGGVIQAQKKVGARFKTMREFPIDQEREATAWAKGQAAAARAAGTPERWRLQWG